ncbi:MAG: SMP-30/gluconolactonase/LRE family protein [Planctomycetaceae bacterium]
MPVLNSADMTCDSERPPGMCAKLLMSFGVACLALVGRINSCVADDHPIFAADAARVLWADGEFTEGVAVRSDGLVFFSDIPRNAAASGRIWMYDPSTTRTTTFCFDSHKSNGLVFDSGDRLFACCGANGGLRALCEVSGTGVVKPLVDRIEGQRFNSPNDLTVATDGSIYFSDPRYVGQEPMELSEMAVYRFDPATGAVIRASADASKPNGVEALPGGKQMLVADTNNGWVGLADSPKQAPGPMRLLLFEITQNHTLTNPRTLFDFGTETGIDGMTIDSHGRIFAAVRCESRFGIGVFDLQGKELDFLTTSELPTNCSFGVGNDAGTLYITAGGSLLSIATKSP